MRANNKPLVSLLILLGGVAFSSNAAPINLNLKSSLLSRWMGKSASSPEKSDTQDLRNDSSEATRTASASERSSSKGKVSLDLSGNYHCLVAGPSQEEGTPTPLYKIGTISNKGWSPPSLTFSVGYNFSQAWYGATRLLTKLQWSYRNADDNLYTSKHSPLTVNLQAEKGLVGDPDECYAGQVGVAFKANDWNAPSLKLRWEPNNCKQVTVAVPLHKRIGVVWRSIFPTQQQQQSLHEFFSSRSFPSQKQDWWLPSLKINTAGRLTADNQVGFVNSKRHLGVRILLSRQLGWSAFGSGIAMDDHLGTLLILQVTGTDHRGFSTVTMESMLECPLVSTHLTLSHEQVHNKN